MIVLFEKNANGKIEFTKEELEALLEQARTEGVKEGNRQNYIYTTPSIPSPTAPGIPYNPYITVTCQMPQNSSDGTSSNPADESSTKNGM